jgi:hypothetical protein
MKGFERCNVFVNVGGVLEQWLEVHDNQVFDLAEGEEVYAEKWQFITMARVHDAIEDFKGFACDHMGVTNFAEFGALVSPTLNGGGGFSTIADFMVKPCGDGAGLEIKFLEQFLLKMLHERLIHKIRLVMVKYLIPQRRVPYSEKSCSDVT